MYISADFNSLGYIHRIPSKIALTHYFRHSSMVRVGRVPVFWTLSVVMNIGHTCVIPGVFFLAIAEWNVDGDG
jgi:hypothetical protein